MYSQEWCDHFAWKESDYSRQNLTWMYLTTARLRFCEFNHVNMYMYIFHFVFPTVMKYLFSRKIQVLLAAHANADLPAASSRTPVRARHCVLLCRYIFSKDKTLVETDRLIRRPLTRLPNGQHTISPADNCHRSSLRVELSRRQRSLMDISVECTSVATCSALEVVVRIVSMAT